jgi:CMP-N-acetylneuraminic acid synthetase
MLGKGANGGTRAIAVIPARGGSKRLPRKNILPVFGRPLLAWSIDAALGSPYVGPGNVFVSTDDAEIATVAEQLGAQSIMRPSELAEDFTWTEPVIQHAVQYLEAHGRSVDLVVWMNACGAEVQTADIDMAVERLVAEDLREIFSVDRQMQSNSIVRVLRRETLFQRRLSVKCGVMVLDYIDIHRQDDVAVVEHRLKMRTSAWG